MGYVYLLKGTSGRHYIGVSSDVGARLARHNSGAVYSTRRLGLPLKLIASRSFPSMGEARRMEAQLKRWKNPAKVLEFLAQGDKSP